MTNPDLEKKKMASQTMLAKIEDVLKRGKEADSPAYTLVLGAGASFGVVPTAKEMLGIPDAKTGKIHEKSVPIWIARQLDSTAAFDDAARLECSKKFWSTFTFNNRGNPNCNAINCGSDGFPLGTSIASAYQAVFDTSCIGGLDTPERHRNYMREVTMAAEGNNALLNATHFYLASLLSLQKQGGKPGSNKQPLYTGRREFARTIFTTNFDPLLQTSLQLFQLLYYMTDRPELLSADALQTDHHPAMHLFYAHGSVHRPYMANTEEQIRLLKQQNARDLAAYLGNHGVIVLGYSGWDDCLLEALNQTKTFSNNLYWLTRNGSNVSEKVVKFLSSHPNAYWVQIDDGGNFMAELHGRLCPGAPNTEMLYNPIRALLCQLQCVSLVGIQAGQIGSEVGSRGGSEKVAAAGSDAPIEVESIRQKVILRLEDAQKLFTDPPQEHVESNELERQADLSYMNKDWEAALQMYDRLLKTANLALDRKSRALYRRGFCHGKQGETYKQIADYTAVIELPAPTKHLSVALLDRGICYGRKGDSDREIADYTAVIELANVSPKMRAKAFFNRGVCYGKKGDADKELADYTAAIELPDAPPEIVSAAQYNRGVWYTVRDETTKCIEDYTAVIERAGTPPDDVSNALINRGVTYAKIGSFEKAIADYSAVIEMPSAPTDGIGQARINRGVLYGKMEDVEKEIADYTAAIELPGISVEKLGTALLYRGISYSEKGQSEKGIADYTSVSNLPAASLDLRQDAKMRLLKIETASTLLGMSA